MLHRDNICVLILVLLANAVRGDEPPLAPVAEASDEGRQAIGGFRIPDTLECRLFAAEPQVANPVAFSIDLRGRVYVVESFRQNRGVTDNRGHDERWRNADLAAQTVEDRIRYHRELLGDKAAEYTRYDDRIRVLEDRDHDGVADFESVLADRFHQLEDGSGAGVLARGDQVYFTCIPHLWMLRDADGDGRADSRTALHSGYGVRVAFRGHDLHGLILGPDGRLYFSLGDRGYHIETPQGTLHDPESGAVFRCELDGSGLEVVATGLRNPQELAFNDQGDLFTGDNNSDSGDRARWVNVLPGSDTGWRMSYQYLGDRGPFNREKIWHPFHADTPAYIVPPVTNFADGPSGLAYYPGTGLGPEYRGRFLLCDFRGTPGNSGIRTFRSQPKGAFFELVEDEQPIWKVLATDLAFAPDGSLLVSDWVDGWNGEGKGRLYRFTSRDEAERERGRAVAALLADIDGQSDESLSSLLAHADQRVRLESQWALATRGARDRLLAAARGESASADATADIELARLARLHGVWGLGQLARRGGADSEPLWDALLGLSADADSEVRAQACKTLTEAPRGRATSALTARLADESPRARLFAALALGRQGDVTAVEPLTAMLAENADQDPALRHAGIVGLAGAAEPARLVSLANAGSRSVRLAAAVALRRQRSAEIARFLTDADPQVALEAARAIHDLPIAEALPALAAELARPRADDAWLRRVLNANYRLGGVEHARALAQFAAREGVSEPMRLEALAMLGAWEKPDPRDRVLGMWRPLAERDAGVASEALRGALPGVLSGPETVRAEGAKVAAGLGITEIAPALIAMVGDAALTERHRADALLALAALKPEGLTELADRSLTGDAPLVRTAARRVVLELDRDRGLTLLGDATRAEAMAERQDALAALAQAGPKARPLVLDALERLVRGEVPADTRLDVLEAARVIRGERLDQLLAEHDQGLPADPVAAGTALLAGGDAARGRRLFFERTEISCVRCHKIQGQGGDVGPDLTKVAADKKREYLLEAILLPSRSIAKNFETVQLGLDDGSAVVGIVRKEDADQLELVTAEGHLVTVAKERIERRREGQSAMPADLAKRLTPFELRDLVEFLGTLR